MVVLLAFILFIYLYNILQRSKVIEILRRGPSLESAAWLWGLKNRFKLEFGLSAVHTIGLPLQGLLIFASSNYRKPRGLRGLS